LRCHSEVEEATATRTAPYSNRSIGQILHQK
jgi:hypothetical protein